MKIPRGLILGVAAACAVLIGACSAGPVSPPATPVPSGFVDLPTLSGIPPTGPNGVLVGCGGVGFDDSILRGSPSDSDHVWLETVADSVRPSQRVSVRWPAGFRAHFVPQLELLDAKGQVVAREGDLLTQIGGAHDPDGRFEIWGFNRHGYDCF